MPNLLSHAELERRLLRWISSAFVPRYPFFEGSFTPGSSTSGFASPFPSMAASGSLQDLNQWYNDIELASNDCEVPVEQYPDVAIYFLKGDLKDVMAERRGVYLKQTSKSYWDWKDFREDLRRIVDEAAKIITSPQMSNLASDALDQLRRTHPFIASSLTLGLMVGGTAVLLPALGMMAWNRLNANQPTAIAAPAR